jgi:ribose transport system permease protein
MYSGMGDSYQMESISAVAIGGIALIGGSGSYVGTVAGVLILTILNGSLPAINMLTGAQKIIYVFVSSFRCSHFK